MVDCTILSSQLSFWGELSESDRAALCRGALTIRYRKGDLLDRTGENCSGLTLVCSGQLRAYMISDEGRELTVLRLFPGEVCVLSSSCLLDSISFETNVQAVTDCEVILVPSAVFSPVRERCAAVQLFLLKTANERLTDALWLMQQIVFLPVDKRLAGFLWDEYSKTHSAVITYTHQEIAAMIGSAREVVSRLLKGFARDGYVRLARGEIAVIDPQGLRGIALNS